MGAPRLRDPLRLLRGLAVVVVVLGLAGGAGVLAGWVTTRGDVEVVAPEPTATPSSTVPPAPEFPADDHPADPAPLRVTGIGATGGADDGQGATVLVDGDGSTAWRGLPPTPDEPVGVVLELEGPAWVRRVEVLNGPPVGTEGTGARLLVLRDEDGRAVEVELLDIEGWQEVTLPEPLRTRRLRLQLLQGRQDDAPVVLREVDVLGHLVADAAPVVTDGP